MHRIIFSNRITKSSHNNEISTWIYDCTMWRSFCWWFVFSSNYLGLKLNMRQIDWNSELIYVIEKLFLVVRITLPSKHIKMISNTGNTWIFSLRHFVETCDWVPCVCCQIENIKVLINGLFITSSIYQQVIIF
jgi:hypothetical protein